MNQLLSQISNLESNPSKNQSELASKKQQLQELQSKEKELTKSLPLDTQITILQREIKSLESKPTKSKTEQSLLDSKKQELEELLKKQSGSNTNEHKPSDKTALIIGCGVV